MGIPMPTLTRVCLTHGYAHDDAPDTKACRFEEWTTMPGEVVAVGIVHEPSDHGFYVIKADDLGYLDTGQGLVPVKVLAINEDGEARVRVTATRGQWTKGHVFNLQRPKPHLLKRTQVFKRKGQTVINGDCWLYTDGGVLLP